MVPADDGEPWRTFTAGAARVRARRVRIALSSVLVAVLLGGVVTALHLVI